MKEEERNGDVPRKQHLKSRGTGRNIPRLVEGGLGGLNEHFSGDFFSVCHQTVALQ